MKNKISRWALPLAIACASPLAGTVWAQIKFPVGAPTPKVGDTAKYRVVDLWNNRELRTSQSELVEIQPDRLVLRATSSARPEPTTLNYTNHWQPCRTMQNSDKAVCAGSMKFPMQLGDKHAYEKLPWPNGMGYSGGNCEVKAEEKITLAVGTFDTVRVECSGFWNRVYGGTFSGNQSEVLWYAPQISRVVKTEFTNYDGGGKLDTRERSELIEFVGKP